MSIPQRTTLQSSNMLSSEYRDAGVILTSCPDGSFCCGFNNTACCNAGQGTLLDARGQVLLSNGQVSTIPGAVYSTSSTSTSSLTASIQSTTTSATLASPTVLTSSTTTPDDTIEGSSTPIGAIVGGAIGGVALLLLVMILILLILRRGKRRNQEYKQPQAYGDPRLGGSATREMASELNVDGTSNERYYNQGRWLYGGYQPFAAPDYPQYPQEADSKPTSRIHEIETPPKQPVELASEY